MEPPFLQRNELLDFRDSDNFRNDSDDFINDGNYDWTYYQIQRPTSTDQQDEFNLSEY